MYGLYQRKHTILKEANDSLAWKLEDHDDDDDDDDDIRIFDIFLCWVKNSRWKNFKKLVLKSDRGYESKNE